MMADSSLSRIGLGCVTFGREIDQRTSFELMDYAYANGITFFDTAAAYAAGASERIVGQWLNLNGISAQAVTVATKILPPYTRQNIQAGVEQSLARLQMDTLDLLYLHHWDPSVESTDTLFTMEEMVRKGKVRKLGISNFTAQQIHSAVTRQIHSGLTQFQFVQNNHNYAVSDVTDEFYQLCAQFKIAIVGYSPLGAGFLTGKYVMDLPEDSRFSRLPGHQQIYFQEAAGKRLAWLRELSDRTGYSTIQLALAWELHQKKISSTLIGVRKREHINQALEAVAFNSLDVLRQLDEFTSVCGQRSFE